MALMMDDDKAKEMFEMVKDNNRMLRSMRRNAFIGGILKIIVWVFFLIVIPYVTWLYLQPYFDLILNQYKEVQGQSEEAKNLIEQFKSAGNQIPGYDTILKYFGSQPTQ